MKKSLVLHVETVQLSKKRIESFFKSPKLFSNKLIFNNINSSPSCAYAFKSIFGVCFSHLQKSFF